jgi:programmed cell death 6-interacting protein
LVNLSAAIKQYISTKYDQHPDMFTDDLRLIDELRGDATNVQEAHVSGIKRLTSYAAQLRWIGGKFPIDVGVDFPWYPALGFHTNQPVLQNNLRFELANILFNLAVLYSQLAFATNRTTGDGLKTAAQYGVSAAGTLSFLRTEIIPDMRSTPPEDMDNVTLESLENLCLAQSQECFWQKAVKDGMKDGTIARLAAKVSDYYSIAEDYAIKSNAISTEWIHHMAAKQHHFAAAAQYRQALDCLDKRKYGEEVARLRDSIACVNEALKESKFINKTVLGDLNGLKTKVTEDLKRAERDNDVIYLLPVPPKAELKLLDRANMVSSKCPMEVINGVTMLSAGGPYGPPLFAKLVPYAVHQAASIYADRRDRLVNQSIIADLEAMTAKLREILQSLNLPGSLQALEKPLGLPSSLVSKAEELRQQDAHYRLRRSMEDAAKLKSNDLSIYQEGLELLKAEKTEDDRARAKYGTDRWNRQPSEIALQKLYTQSNDLQGYLNSAASSDEVVRTKMRDNEKILRVLTSTNRDLESYVPSSRRLTMTPPIEQSSMRLRACLNEVSRLETRRKRKIEELRDKAKADDINPALLGETARLEREYPMQKIEASQFETLFDQRLEVYEQDLEMVHTEQDEQDQLMARVREANKNSLDARKGDSSTRERERALQDLETGYVRYKEIVSNLETGRKFYNDLAGHVSRFREACKVQVAQRKTEAGHLEADIANSEMVRLNLEETSASLQQQKRQQENVRVSAPQVFGHTLEPLTAPVPTRAVVPPVAAAAPVGMGGVWLPDMGIRFGGPASQANAGYPQPRRG